MDKFDAVKVCKQLQLIPKNKHYTKILEVSLICMVSMFLLVIIF